MDHATASHDIPHATHWPIIGAVALFAMTFGFALWLNETSGGGWVMLAGFAALMVMLFGWFGEVIAENIRRPFSTTVDRSYRHGMAWFIFTEVMFFAVFFSVLLYTRQLTIPWLAGEGNNFFTNLLLWPDFENVWPTEGPAATRTLEIIGAWGIPALNTAILLLSGVTLTIAHHALIAGHRRSVAIWLAATWLLGLIFLGFQAYEYVHAYVDLELRLDSGIYGSIFFMLTGFHGLHVTLGAIMLIVIWLRILRGHFNADRHFAFEAVAWYWHFVDIVWLGLFVFVYWL
jgi:cytochrome c oxidase subunit III